MRPKTLCALAALAALAVATAAWQLAPSHANPGAPPAPSGDAAGKPPAPKLPITHVVLFTSGVGYFERQGTVDGDARVDLTFDAADVNDLLKSLVLQDAGGGKVGAVHYDSNDPLDRVLRSFALDLTGNPSFGQLLNQARGEKVEIVRQPKAGGQSHKLTGTVVGMQAQWSANAWATLGTSGWDHERLNLLTADGLLSVPFDEVQAVRFLNPALESEFHRALRVLAGAHDVQKKAVSVGFRGQGKRQVRVGYVVERPIWKTTYRLVLDKDGKAHLQGWAIVENTSDDDWKDVRLVLVSGRPISFKMNLYEPLYVPRPLVEPETFAALRPALHAGAIDGVPPPPGQVGGVPTQGLGFGQGWGGMGMAGGMYGGGMGMYGGGIGMSGGQGQGWNPYQAPGQGFIAAPQRLTYEEWQKRREEAEEKRKEAGKEGARISGLNFKEGIEAVASGSEVGDHYQHTVDQKVSLPRQKSALLPILNENVEGAKVSVYNPTVHPRHPLLGLRVKNTTGQRLTQGPVTVYDGGAYAGDTRFLDLQPGEERLVSYALDQATEVRSESKTAPGPLMTFKIGDDGLTAAYRQRQTKTYVVRNRSAHERSVVIEHPVRNDWQLVAPAKPTERSRGHYRFAVKVAAGQTVRFEVAEEQPAVDTFKLVTGREARYAVANGVEVKTVVATAAEELAGVKIVKGMLHTRHRQRESKAYFVQNNSPEEKTVQIDHVVRSGWRRVEGQGEGQAGPAVHRLTLKAAAGKTAQGEVIEERTWDKAGGEVGRMGDEALRGLLAAEATGPKVKDALRRLLAAGAKRDVETRKLAELEKQLRTLNEDQARLRDNLKIVPANSDAHKNFLQKFVAQEAESDRLRTESRRLEALTAKQREEYHSLAGGLDVE